jgi:hypothetical protein
MIIPEKSFFRALELAFMTAGDDVSQLSELVEKPSRIFTYPNEQQAYSFFAVDLIFRDDDAVVLQEANGSNGASTGMLADGQARRARHMAEAALFKAQARPWVAILAYANKTGLKAEFHTRAALFAQEMALARIGRVVERGSGEVLGDEDISVVIGPISHILNDVTVIDEALHYQGRRVGFATNANIIPALERSGKIQRTPGGFSFDASVFHEGARGVTVALDKIEQQRAADHSGLTPLRSARCPTWEETVAQVRSWHQLGITAVAKIANGSQGIGIAFLPPSESTFVEEAVSKMRQEALLAYGENADATALPVGLFEFAASTRYSMRDGPHLWDIRVECHVSPGNTTLIPDSMRICPGIFDQSKFTREAVLSNLSGRGVGLTFVRTPFASHDADRIELEWANVADSKFTTAMESLARWCEHTLGEEFSAKENRMGGKHEPERD